MDNYTGEKIKAYRKKAGLTQYDMAEELNISDTSYRKYEKGEVIPSLETLYRLANYFAVNPRLFVNPEIRGKSRLVFSADYEKEYNESYDILYSALESFLSIQPPAKKYENDLDEDQNDQYIRFLLLYDRLNKTGQQEALKRLEEMTKLDEYKKQK